MAAPTFTITKVKIRNHFHYFWWQYALLIVLAIFGWNLLFHTTHYRSPEYLKVEWYYEGPVGQRTNELTRELLDRATAELFPEMEEVTFTMVGNDAQYGQMQIMVWSTAGQGDLYMLPTESFATLANSGVLCDLQPYVDNGTLNVEGIDISGGYWTDPESGEKWLVGIPTDALPGFYDYEVEHTGKWMGILIHGGNTENTVKLMAYFLDTMR